MSKKILLVFMFFLIFLRNESFGVELFSKTYHSQFLLNPKTEQVFLRFLSVNDKIIDEGKIGYKQTFLSFGSFEFVSLAFIHIYMHPVNNKFNVEHFFAGLGLGFEYHLFGKYHLAVLPLYHESAHLADGYQLNIETNKKIISNEAIQIRLEQKYDYIITLIQFDYYWHSIERQLHYNTGVGIQWTGVSYGMAQLVIAGYGFIISDKNGVSFNSQFLMGVNVKNKMTIGWFYENQNGLGQDYAMRQRGYGLSLNFLL